MFLNVKPLPPVVWENGDCYGDPIPDECKIPSEFIEPYVQRFLMMCLEELAFYKTPVSEIKARFDGVRYFVSCYGGIHAEMATNNIFFKTDRIPDDKLREIAKQIFDKANAKNDEL